MPTPTAYIYLGVWGNFDPREFADCILLLPDESIANHSRNSERQVPKDSILRYALAETFSEFVDIYELAEKSVGILEPHLESFVSAIQKHDADVALNIVLSFPVFEGGSTPAIGFSKRVILFVASVGASIDIDTYRASQRAEAATET